MKSSNVCLVYSRAFELDGSNPEVRLEGRDGIVNLNGRRSTEPRYGMAPPECVVATGCPLLGRGPKNDN
jgi:hypothetical protein